MRLDNALISLTRSTATSSSEVVLLFPRKASRRLDLPWRKLLLSAPPEIGCLLPIPFEIEFSAPSRCFVASVIGCFGK